MAGASPGRPDHRGGPSDRCACPWRCPAGPADEPEHGSRQNRPQTLPARAGELLALISWLERARDRKRS
ncbi:hypothetical protein FAGKG844_90080 [Frankia sp. AgKG'84/4]